MLDSTLIERVGKHLTPDEKYKNSSNALRDLLESSFFKRTFKKRCEKTLSQIGKKRTYYRKYRKEKKRVSKVSLERVLQNRDLSRGNKSALLEERISKLEFLFKKVAISRKPEHPPTPFFSENPENNKDPNAS